MTDQTKWMPSDEALWNFDIAARQARRWTDMLPLYRELLSAAVEKALAEQEARHREDLRVITEATRMAADKRAERHKRELIEARIEELTKYAYCGCDTDGYDCEPCLRADELRAELAALTNEVTP